ncbi:MAG: ABC transporter permease [Ruminococcaceae bacterium]|nr:ABC transporter permease [Oscillospiraceae bacterium]
MKKINNFCWSALFKVKSHIIKRDELIWWKAWGIRVIAVFLALIVCGIVTVSLTDLNPVEMYITMIEGAIGTSRLAWNLFQNTAILLCVALAVTPAFKMKFWNIGGEGQILIGGFTTAICMIFLGGVIPDGLLIPIMFLASIISGAIWGLIPAIFKTRFNSNETLFTLMMNYVAVQIVAYYTLEWSVPKGSGTPRPLEFGQLPVLFGQKYLINILIVAVITVIVYIYLKYSKQGYEISVVGESEKTARYIGINVGKVVLRTMAISGALCGVAGFLLVAGTDHSLKSDTSGGRGFTAIMVSWLAKFDPIFMILTSLLIVFLQKGASKISEVYRLNSSFSDIITGIIIFFIIGCEFFINYKIKFNKKEANV